MFIEYLYWRAQLYDKERVQTDIRDGEHRKDYGWFATADNVCKMCEF